MSQLPAIPNPNNIPISLAASNLACLYPLGKVRQGMPIQEYINYKNDWNFFNKVWAYNYTVSTLNSVNHLSLQPYQFMSNGDHTSYTNGQISHVSYYSNVSPTVFNNIF
jgi:hypothetical protein